jgi:hypothetical protein
VKNDAPIPLPYIESGYVPELLYEVGPVSFSPMGAAPIDDVHLRAWMQNNVELPPWLSRLLKRLSSDYLGESQRATKPGCPQPWTEETPEEARERIAAQVRGATRMFGRVTERRK